MLLGLTVSISRRKAIRSPILPDVIDLPAFAQDDLIIGQIGVVSETGDPTAPTTPVTVSGSNKIALTDGVDVIYADASIDPVTPPNLLNFSMTVDSPILDAAMLLLAEDYITAFFEVRATAEGEDVLILREAVTINKTAT